MTVFIPVLCPDCQSSNVFKHGFSKDRKQRYRCENAECKRRTFILNHSHPGRTKEVKRKILKMAHNGSGVRHIARVLNISQTTVMKELRKIPKNQSSQRHTAFRGQSSSSNKY